MFDRQRGQEHLKDEAVTQNSGLASGLQQGPWVPRGGSGHQGPSIRRQSDRCPGEERENIPVSLTPKKYLLIS